MTRKPLVYVTKTRGLGIKNKLFFRIDHLFPVFYFFVSLFFINFAAIIENNLKITILDEKWTLLCYFIVIGKTLLGIILIINK